MKKIIIILFLFLLCLSCYFIYNKTKNNKLCVTQIGDYLVTYNYFENNDKISNVNMSFTNNDMRIIDLENNLINHDDINYDENIHQVLKKTDILILAVGMNDIYYKLNDNTKNIYTYLNNMIIEYEKIMLQISKYNYKEVIVFGYYNITGNDNDLFTYINYKVKRIVDKYNYTFIDLNRVFNNQDYLLKKDNIYLNEKGFRQIYNLIVEN